MICLTEIIKDEDSYKFKPVLINPQHLVSAKTREFTPEYATITTEGDVAEQSKPREVSEIQLHGALPFGVTETVAEIKEQIKGKLTAPSNVV